MGLSLLGRYFAPWFPFFLWIFTECDGCVVPVVLACLASVLTGNACLCCSFRKESEGFGLGEEREREWRESASRLPGFLAGVACGLAGGAYWSWDGIQTRVGGGRLGEDGLWDAQEMWAARREDCSSCSLAAPETRLGDQV